MTAKEYLGQAYRLDQRINSKLEQVLSLRDLTTKATATMSDMPGGGSRNVFKIPPPSAIRLFCIRVTHRISFL